ncbi:MAG: hypothetical protein KAI72_08230 [Candidatus Pacebacteria bacterium]|nr:hypothetical protein [Candidatus Paceibacterota bacterium]
MGRLSEFFDNGGTEKLKKTALNTKNDSYDRIDVIWNLKNHQDILADIALDEKEDPFDRIIAIGNLEDQQDVLAKIALNENKKNNPSVIFAAIENLEIPSVLLKIAANQSNDPNVCKAAANRLIKPSILARHAEEYEKINSALRVNNASDKTTAKKSSPPPSPF